MLIDIFQSDTKIKRFEGCVRYIFASLFSKSKGEHFKSSFRSSDNQILTFQIFRCHDVIKMSKT